jgi:predicted transcriptional regulator
MNTDELVWTFMLAYQDRTGNPPKMDEIREAIPGLTYRSSVRQVLVRLLGKGMVEHDAPNKARCWRAV